jgi:hypothetical protein
MRSEHDAAVLLGCLNNVPHMPAPHTTRHLLVMFFEAFVPDTVELQSA